MDFSLTEEQKMLKTSARDILKSECPASLVKEMGDDENGYSPRLWRKMAGFGWQGLVFPEEYGGSGGTFLDLVVLLEETGRVLLPGPLVTTVLSGIAILEQGSDEQKAEFLPRIAGGDIIVSLAITEPHTRLPGGTVTTVASPRDSEYIISGTKLFVPLAQEADYLLCTAVTGEKSGDVSMFIVDARSQGITYTPLTVMARDRQYEVQFENVTVPSSGMVGAVNSGGEYCAGRLVPMAVLAQCAEMNGGSRKVIDMTVEFARDRKTFGQPLGSHQAIQHLCADMFVALESAQVLTYHAAWKLCQGLDVTKDVSMAKYKANECYTLAVRSGTQIQGGTSIITDHDLPLYYRRAKATEITLGNTDYHLEQIAATLLD